MQKKHTPETGLCFYDSWAVNSKLCYFQDKVSSNMDHNPYRIVSRAIRFHFQVINGPPKSIPVKPRHLAAFSFHGRCLGVGVAIAGLSLTRSALPEGPNLLKTPNLKS